MVELICDRNDTRPGDSVEDIMVRCCNNRQPHHRRPKGRKGPEEAVRAKLHQTIRNEDRISEVQGWHCGDDKLEFIMCPGRFDSVLVQHVNESICRGKQAWRHAAPEREGSEGNDVFQRHRPPDPLILVPLEECITVNVEPYSQYNVGIVDAGEDLHEPWYAAEDELLHLEFNVQVEEVL